MYLVEKNHRWIDLQYKIIITKYLNIAIAFHQTRACARGCSTTCDFFQQDTFFYSIYFIIKYNIELIFANTSIIEY
jgi:hypothetical protein